jgi:hypothetical protein
MPKDFKKGIRGHIFRCHYFGHIIHFVNGSAAFAKKLRQAREPSAEIFFVCFVFLVSLVDLVFLRKLEWLQILEMLTCYR